MLKPTSRLDRDVAARVERYGWAVQGVHRLVGELGEPFHYTVGMSAKSLPELITSGLPDDDAVRVLNMSAKRMVEHGPLPLGELAGITRQLLRVVPAPIAPVNVARRLFGEAAVTALQILWPSAAGDFPTQPGWSRDFEQEVFSTVAV